ncbi:UDP-glucose 6-dehydrogenase [Clostridia bacterium]|nr:UDP-glucose 6-dehydrogenase [Clostridia bacterium]
MTILIVGLGFVGLTTALGFADKGFQVFGYDSNRTHSDKIHSGEVPFVEPGLPEALGRNLGANFKVVENMDEFTAKADIVFLCVGTPCDESGRADLNDLKSGIDSIADKVNAEGLLVIKSTVPPGTTQKEIIPYVRTHGLKASVAVNPEFLREGWCWSDFTKPDRIVCGIDEGRVIARTLLSELYAPFDAPMHFVTPNTAEFIKYLSNSLLANLISFSNEMAGIAVAAGDVSLGEAFKILHEDNRLSGAGINSYIYPGCGYGGYCLPKDTTALIQSAKSNGFEANILQEVVTLNESMPRLTAEKIIRKTKDKTDKIGILGLSFKPNSDDVRYSPAAKIIEQLLVFGYQNIYVYDPVANDKFKEYYKFPLHYCPTKEDVCSICSVVALVTIWREFKGINKIYPHIVWEDCRYFL